MMSSKDPQARGKALTSNPIFQLDRLWMRLCAAIWYACSCAPLTRYNGSNYSGDRFCFNTSTYSGYRLRINKAVTTVTFPLF